jgi:ectoine hydroxylase-related dioxygenase (phytanoyl-CoA dioxygenase family)
MIAEFETRTLDCDWNIGIRRKMHLENIASDFRRDGYAMVHDFFDAALMDTCTAAILDHYGVDPAYEHAEEFVRTARTEVVSWYPLVENVSPFVRINEHPLLKELTTQILGDGWRDMSCMVMFSKSGSAGQAWHQDCLPDSAAQFNLNRLVYTHDIDPANGGEPVVVPGSHRMGALPVGEPHGTLEGQRVVKPRKGTLLLLHGHTWHRVLPIKGSRWRASTNYRVVPDGVADDVTDVAVYRNMMYNFSSREVVERGESEWEEDSDQ